MCKRFACCVHCPLQVVASSLDVLQPIILEDFACKNDLAASLRASANVPEIAGSYVVHRCGRWVPVMCGRWVGRLSQGV